MKIDWKNLTSIVGFIGALGGGYYKLDQDNQQMVVEQQSIQQVKYVRWQLDSLRMERKIQELKWEMRDSLKMEIARLKDELKN
tara:strand:- start:518 stop:766 length:249 start_codon:yes stop_codon:yes gene_type:complete